ncbi:hypothetical protein CSA56_04030, partial [candidate division KSB3 bacterium]
MFIILPVSHEHMEAARFPYITLGIVLLNTLIFLVTVISVNHTSEQHFHREAELVEYYVNSYTIELYALDFPQATFDKLSPGSQRYIREFKEYTFDRLITSEHEDANVRKAFQAAQAHLDQLVEAFEEAYRDNFIRKYGYIPARGGIATIFSSIFLHGGLLHLLGNMLFLWLSGCNIEDRWGRVIYPIFYLTGGILATLVYGAMYSESTIPLIGASGAIAAVMGAFMIRMYATKIHFVYFFFFFFRFRRGRISVPAYVVLLFWFLQQFWGVMMGQQGVAFWAHIGGFVFGAVVAVLMKISGIETRIIAPAIEKKTAIVDEHLALGVENLRNQDIEGAIRELKLALKTNPNDPITHNELSKAYFAYGNTQLALREFKRTIFLYIKHGEMGHAVDEYLELHAEMPQLMLDPPQQRKLAEALEKRAETVQRQHS